MNCTDRINMIRRALQRALENLDKGIEPCAFCADEDGGFEYAGSPEEARVECEEKIAREGLAWGVCITVEEFEVDA